MVASKQKTPFLLPKAMEGVLPVVDLHNVELSKAFSFLKKHASKQMTQT
jgi:hypothetical protein